MFKAMNKRDLNQINKILTAQLKELLGRADCSLQGLSELEENLSDPIDIAAQVSERNFSNHLCSREKLLIRKIERALQDIEDGVYGFCDQCEEQISIKRLKASPTARYCIDCKTKLETRKRMIGG
jgi:DnaK suppressor protein